MENQLTAPVEAEHEQPKEHKESECGHQGCVTEAWFAYC
jgi:hypothetical protein